MSEVTLADITLARELTSEIAVQTPMEASRWLSALVGGDVWLKCENLQRTGSFKIRGAFVRISRLTPEERRRGVVADRGWEWQYQWLGFRPPGDGRKCGH